MDFDRLVLRHCHAAFGEAVTHLPGGGAPLALTATFNDRFTETKFQDGEEISETTPVLFARAALFACYPLQGDQFLIRGRYYVATDVLPDSHGELKIPLRRAGCP